jgi:hypothetical protein
VRCPQGCRCITWRFRLRLVPRSLRVSSTRTYPNRVYYYDMYVLHEALRLWCWHFSWFKADPFVTPSLTRYLHLTLSPDSSTPPLQYLTFRSSSVYSSMADVPGEFMMPSGSRPFWLVPYFLSKLIVYRIYPRNRFLHHTIQAPSLYFPSI